MKEIKEKRRQGNETEDKEKMPNILDVD